MSFKLLLIGEAVTLSHIARPLALAAAIKEFHYNIAFAWDTRYKSFLPQGAAYFPLSSIEPSLFTQRVNDYKFPYNRLELEDYVKKDLDLIDQVKPDLIIGDFRITLAISARLKKIPYCSLFSNYWLPEHAAINVSLNAPPDHFMLRFYPSVLRSFLFKHLGPLFYRFEAAPFNKVAKSFNILSACGDLLKVYTQSDHTLLVEPLGWTMSADGPQYSHIGPVRWHSELEGKPHWWNQWDRAKPSVLISVGSSGTRKIIDFSLDALKNFSGQIFIAGDDQVKNYSLGQSQVFTAPFLPNSGLLKHCQLFISNGGSLSMVDALSEGVPVIGVTSNYDQYLNASILKSHGGGEALFARTLTKDHLKNVVVKWLNQNREGKKKMEQIETIFKQKIKAQKISQIINRLILEQKK